MNTTNPFQVPSCLQRALLQQRRQNRLKQIVIGSIAILAVLLIFLLVAGCMSDHAKAAALTKSPLAAVAETLPLPPVATPAPAAVVTTQSKPVTPPVAVAIAPLRNVK